MDSAPRFLGIDEHGREVLVFIEGAVPHDRVDVPETRHPESLAAVARAVRGFHDLTAGTALAGDAEVVCHHDLAPKNTIYATDGGSWKPIAIIDWDLAAPGRRLDDVAHMCWQYSWTGSCGGRSDAPEASTTSPKPAI